MLNHFKKYISDQALFVAKDKILLAVSGGKDSVAMAHLFSATAFDFGIAHCNFKLRDEASDKDAQFVEQLAKDFQVPFFSISFETAAYAEQEKISIQMAARDLRYQWLESIRSSKRYRYIATAHHFNDSIETVIYNFSKGCGIRGLHGIQAKTGMIIRPLLFAFSDDIKEYITSNNLSFREDASNASDKYSRNFIRHQVIPKLKSLNPSFERSSQETLEKINAAEFLFDQAIQHYKDQLWELKNENIYIAFTKLPKEAATTILYEWLKPLGFIGDQINNIWNDIHQSGIQFSSDTHTLLIDRDHYIIKRKKSTPSQDFLIQETDSICNFGNYALHLQQLNTLIHDIPVSQQEVFLDYKKLKFPLSLRLWKPGDIFQPIGLNGKHQKVKNLLTNLKLNRFEKEKTYVLVSDQKICWVVGKRLDERFKIRQETTQLLKISLKQVPAIN